MTPASGLHRVTYRYLACLAAVVYLLVSLSGCSIAEAGTPPLNTAPALPSTSTQAPAMESPTSTLAPTAAPASPAPSIWLAEDLPSSLRESIHIPDGWQTSSEPVQDGLQVRVLQSGEQAAGDEIATWVYALAAPFPTITDEVSASDLKKVWSDGSVKDLPFDELLVDSSTWSNLSVVLGQPSSSVQVVLPDQILDKAWETSGAWAILPFEQLEPRWKVILIDGQSPVRKDFDSSNYPLKARFILRGAPELRERFLEGQSILASNRDPQKLTTVMLTGVTALVRGTASLMEVIGLDYPAKDIGSWLREADILHISNEVPFARDCPQPFEWKDLVFCSQGEYIGLLEDVGADVIELTGDHFADWGSDAMLYTLELYKERGWPYYGGGATLAEAQMPARLEHNGNKIAFLGCNGKEPGYATAGETKPGAAHCDFPSLAQQIQALRADGYLPIVTFQHLEYYQYIALPELQTDFHQVSAAGAAIVSGSQAHQPHAFEFRDRAFLHYGLGNLFFDQTNQGDPPRTAFIDRHVIYNGRHISTELLTIYLVDYARSRPMTPDERETMLDTVFQASGW